MPLTGGLVSRFGRPAEESQAPTPAAEESLLRSVSDNVVPPAMWFLEQLGKPQQAFFDTLAGDEANELRGTKGYITGRDLLRSYGLAGNENTWGNAAAGTAVDVLADPLNLVGVGVLTKAGKAVSKAGALARAGESLAMGAKRGASLAPEVASRIARGAQKVGRSIDSISDAEMAGRHLIRPRAVNRFGTISQLEDAARVGAKVPGIDDVRSAMSKLPAGEADRLANMPFSKDIGIGVGPAQVQFNVPGGALIRDTVDNAVSGLKFGKAGELTRRVFDNKVGSATDEAAQTIVSGTRTLADDAAAAARRESGEQAARLYGDDAAQVFSEAGNRELAELIERPKAFYDDISKTVTTSVDNATNSLASNPAVGKYLKWWEETAANELVESKKLGLQGESMHDPNLEGYLPRRVNPLIQAYSKKNPRIGPELSTTTPDMLARSEDTKIPGGRNVLSFVLAKDPRLVGPKRTVTSDAAAADIIGQIVFGDAKANRKQTESLARLLHRLPPESLSNSPLFGQHPTEVISQYTAGRAAARKTAEAKLDTIAAHASSTASTAEGPRAPVNEALGRLGLKSEGGYGARDRLREMLAKKSGVSVDQIRLSEFSIPETLFNAIDTPAARIAGEPSSLSGLASWWQSVWRNSILNWPSRYVRDLLGGMYSNLYENALSVRGMSLSTDMMKAGAFDENVVARIQQMPRYLDLKPTEAGSRYYAELAATQLVTGGRRLDYGVAGEAIAETFPGADAPGIGPLTQMLKSFGESLKNIGGMFDPDSKFSQAGAKTGDISDTFNRLSGYNELLYQGYSPDAAAAKMKRTHVDYGSLSESEKLIRSNFVPFYTFTSRMLGEQARRILEEPAKMKRTLSLLTAPQRYSEDNTTITPEYVGEKFGFQLPITNQDPQAKTFLYNADFPGLEQLGALKAVVTGDTGKLVEEFAPMLNPMYKTAAENLTGTQMMPGRPPLSEKVGNLGKLLHQTRMTSDPLTQWADRALEFAPGGARVGNLLRDLVVDDGRSTAGKIGQSLLNNVTGFKVKTYDRDAQLYEAMNQQRNYIKETMPGAMKESRREFVPKELVPGMDYRDQQKVETWKTLQKTLNQRNQLKRGMANPG